MITLTFPVSVGKRKIGQLGKEMNSQEGSFKRVTQFQANFAYNLILIKASGMSPHVLLVRSHTCIFM